MSDKYSILQTYFGYGEFRGGQEPVIDAILSGRDAVGIMPTGAGKSLCYQIPALLLEGVTLVVSPLISLMKDQVGALVQAGIPAAYINSSLTAGQVRRVMENIRYGQYKLIYVAPERLLTEQFQHTVAGLDIAFLAVDEAHCVSQWGQDFRPSYLDIGEFVRQLPNRPVIAAFTATATEQVRRDIIDLLDLRDPFGITTGFDRPNLYFAVQHPPGRAAAAVEFVAKRRGKSGIVYCLTRKDVEGLCESLRKKGIAATRYHAGLSEGERRENQERFQSDECPVMVATNAFGMGIDKSNVAYVLHVGMPKNLESYYQEAGRAGRDGSPAECVLLYTAKDIATNTFFIERDQEGQEGVDPETLEQIRARDRARLNRMVGYCKTQACLRKYILGYFGEKSGENCGNCFNCTHQFERRDITIEAQKILSCVKRLGERYGKAVLTDVLKGEMTGKAVEWGLDRIPTYGAMGDVSKKQIREYIDTLADMDYLTVTESDIARGLYPVVKLGERARDVLFGGQRVEISVVHQPPEERRRAGRRKVDPRELYGNTLFAKLRALRADLAKSQGVPAYVIFTDATLLEMSKVIPVTEEEFLGISGVGQSKLNRYGEAFLTLLREHRGGEKRPVIQKRPDAQPGERDHSWSVYEESLLQIEVESGLGVAEIADQHERPEQEVLSRLRALGYDV